MAFVNKRLGVYNEYLKRKEEGDFILTEPHFVNPGQQVVQTYYHQKEAHIEVGDDAIDIKDDEEYEGLPKEKCWYFGSTNQALAHLFVTTVADS